MQMMPCQKRRADRIKQKIRLFKKIGQKVGRRRRERTTCQTKEGIKEKANSQSKTVPWLHRMVLTFFAPRGLRPGAMFMAKNRKRDGMSK